MTRSAAPILILTCGCLLGGVVAEVKCPSHCDERGRFVGSFPCLGSAPYCCGNSSTMYCCSDWYNDISQLYNDQCFCNDSNCLYRNWEAIASVITMVVLFALVMCCCCANHCYKGKPFCHSPLCALCPAPIQRHCPAGCCQGRSAPQRTPNASGELNEIREGAGERPVLRGPDLFDPANPYAFSPPEYEVVCKGPPSYEELEQSAAGAHAYDNAAYERDVTATGSSSAEVIEIDEQSNSSQAGGDVLHSQHGCHSDSAQGDGSHGNNSCGDSSHGASSQGATSSSQHRSRTNSLQVNPFRIPSSGRTNNLHLHRASIPRAISLEDHDESNSTRLQHDRRVSPEPRQPKTMRNLTHIRNPVIDSRHSLSPRVGGASASRDQVWEESEVLEDPPPYTEEMRETWSRPNSPGHGNTAGSNPV